jgi:hypothetical protein
MCFPSPGSLGRNLTDSPPRSISTGVYVGIQISQGKIHYVPCVLALRKNRKENSKGSIFVFIAFSKRSRWAEMECHLSLLEQTKIDRAKNDQSLLASCTKTLTKFSKPLRQNFQAGQWLRSLLPKNTSSSRNSDVDDIMFGLTRSTPFHSTAMMLWHERNHMNSLTPKCVPAGTKNSRSLDFC